MRTNITTLFTSLMTIMLLSCTDTAPQPIEADESSDTETFAITTSDKSNMQFANKEVSEIGLVFKDKQLMIHFTLVAQTGEGNKYDTTIRTWETEKDGSIKSRAIAKGTEVTDSTTHKSKFVFKELPKALLLADFYRLQPSAAPQFSYVSDKNRHDHKYLYMIRTNDFTNILKYTLKSERYKVLREFIDGYVRKVDN